MTHVLRKHGRVDMRVDNAGVGCNHDVLEVTKADWDQVMDVNLKGPSFVTQAVARRMVERGFGRIVHLGSHVGMTTGTVPLMDGGWTAQSCPTRAPRDPLAVGVSPRSGDAEFHPFLASAQPA